VVALGGADMRYWWWLDVHFKAREKQCGAVSRAFVTSSEKACLVGCARFCQPESDRREQNRPPETLCNQVFRLQLQPSGALQDSGL
jgi:hypothetical protein